MCFRVAVVPRAGDIRPGPQRQPAAEAKVWALLLDAGTAGVSLLRLYETLQRRANAASKISLLGCITASVVMNLLHTPSRSPGGYVVAAVPPVMYAVFLEHLLTNVRNVLVRDEERRSMWRTSTLWINFPALMWNTRRDLLRQEAEGTSDAPVDVVSQRAASSIERTSGAGRRHRGVSPTKAPTRAFRRGRGPGPKRVAFEAALKDQVQPAICACSQKTSASGTLPRIRLPRHFLRRFLAERRGVTWCRRCPAWTRVARCTSCRRQEAR